VRDFADEHAEPSLSDTTATARAVMPLPQVYEREYAFWPWGKLLTQAADLISSYAPRGGFLVDYMCGTGFLLNEIARRRPDLSLLGCDINQGYVEYARCKYPRINVVEADARFFQPPRPVSFAICTAGLHHLPRPDQPIFLEKVSNDLVEGGWFLLGEELIRDHENENGRKNAVLELFKELMSYLDKTAAPVDVVEAAANTFVNDWCERGEHKVSRRELERILAARFEIVSIEPIWTDASLELGDWLFLCKGRPDIPLS
jgi:SAM-dependent methyltransferase